MLKSFLLEFLATASLRTHVWIWRKSTHAALPAAREVSQGHGKAHRTQNTSITSLAMPKQRQLRLWTVITHIRSRDSKLETFSSFPQRTPHLQSLASSKTLCQEKKKSWRIIKHLRNLIKSNSFHAIIKRENILLNETMDYKPEHFNNKTAV